MEWVETTGRTVEDAKEAALDELGVDESDAEFEVLEEARAGLGGRMMSVGVHSRWTGQPGRASALRDFIEYATGHDDVAFFRRIDIADFWTATFPP